MSRLIITDESTGEVVELTRLGVAATVGAIILLGGLIGWLIS